ncbi:MAG: hypothetical protein ACR2MP_09955 [Streptosporangiaceae bacterium]
MAEAVAAELMSRVAANVDTLVHRLDAAGWRWAYPEMRRCPPDEEDKQAVTAIENAIGPLPLALRALLLHVGEAWLCGSFPSWSPPAYAFDDLAEYPVMADPLVLPSAKWMLQELTGWDTDDWCQPKRPWRFGLAPDEILKAGISGGTLCLLLPTTDSDPVIENEDWQRADMTLIAYLRTSLRFAGFPGFEFRKPIPPLVTELQRELIPF